jgi:hypothetical protein
MQVQLLVNTKCILWMLVKEAKQFLAYAIDNTGFIENYRCWLNVGYKTTNYINNQKDGF